MKVHAIDVEKLKREGHLSSLWYQFENGDLYLLLSPQQINYFEFTQDDLHLEGGADRSLKFGKIIESHAEEVNRIYNRSRIVEYYDQCDEEFLKWCQRFMYECPNLEPSLKEGVMEYLEYRGQKSDLLTLAEGEFSSYRHPTAPASPPLNFKEHKGTLRLIVIFTFVLWPIFYFIQQKRIASDVELKNKCAQGNQASCDEIKSAQVVTMDKGILKTSNAPILNSQDAVEKCLSEDNCDYGLLKTAADLKDSQLARFCFEKEQAWACLKYFMILKNRRAEDSALALEKTRRELQIHCQKNQLDQSFCLNLANSNQKKKQQAECLKNSNAPTCDEYYLEQIELGRIVDHLNVVESKCSSNNAKFCLELGRFYFDDKAHANYQSRKSKALALWRKGCLELNEPNSCYYFSVKGSDTPVAIKEQKRRKKLLLKCNSGSESHCRSLRRVAEENL